MSNSKGWGLGNLHITALNDIDQAARDFEILVDALAGLSDRAVCTLRHYARAEPGSEDFETFLDALRTARKKRVSGDGDARP